MNFTFFFHLSVGRAVALFEPVRIVRVLLHWRTIWPVGQGLESVNKSLGELQAEEECEEEDEEDDEWM